MILESEPLPTIVPIFIEGLQNTMDEERGFPRFAPRIGKHISINFGEPIDGESMFGDLRDRWRTLVKREMESLDLKMPLGVGELTKGLMYGDDAVELRIECTRRVRQQVLKVRRSLGLPDEDPKDGLAETWRLEGTKLEGKA
jgi:monolysocardiolipin acyltransferase